MRKVMMAVMAVASAGLMTTGCERKAEVQRQREDVAEARIDVAKAQQEQQRELAEARQEQQKDLADVQKDTQEDVLDAKKDLADEQKDLNEAQARQMNDQFDRDSMSATGGSGMTATAQQEIQGTIQATTNNTLTILVPSEDSRLMTFKSDSALKVMRDDKPLALSSLKAGDEVRASYSVDENGLRTLHSVDVTKTSAQHPMKMK